MASSLYVAICDSVSLGTVFVLLLLLFFLHYLMVKYEFRGMPPGPRLTSLPVLGNVFSLDFKAEKLTGAFESLRTTYGGVFSLKIGSYKFVMASTPEAVKELLVTKSVDFAGRPQTFSTIRRTLGGKDLAFANYGPAWKFHRKLFTTSLRNYITDIPMIDKRVSAQAVKLVRFMEEQEGKPFDPANCLMRAVADVICGITFGEGLDTTHPDLKKLLELCAHVVDNEETAQLVTMLDFFPWAKYLPINAYDDFIQPFFEMHKIIRRFLKEREDSLNPRQPAKDFVSGLLSAREEAKIEDDKGRSSFLCDDYLVNSIQNMFGAGYETTSTTLKWAIAFLVNYPKYQEDIHRQLDEAVGGRSLSLNDRPSLPLIQATIIETLRVGNVGPLLLPHVTNVDTTLRGYRVPKGTFVFANTETVHLDPKCWEDPLVFNPYRHIDKDGKFITSQSNFYPFGAGRRVCAGEVLAKVELFLFISWLLQHFTFVAEKDGHPPSLKGIFSITQFPVPYKIRAIIRKP
ncbi:steroid 17-alpha-hydroxylase/17,20 lyase-like [Montipora foliosa]|uniref:steroid 17-alpha-hydroxylase/17,20 lyase-like n=1 Tax=Montipora foliosa TaxID=591990 RepID=UPI0035F19604